MYTLIWTPGINRPVEYTFVIPYETAKAQAASVMPYMYISIVVLKCSWKASRVFWVSILPAVCIIFTEDTSYERFFKISIAGLRKLVAVYKTLTLCFTTKFSTCSVVVGSSVMMRTLLSDIPKIIVNKQDIQNSWFPLNRTRPSPVGLLSFY